MTTLGTECCQGGALGTRITDPPNKRQGFEPARKRTGMEIAINYLPNLVKRQLRF